MTRWPGSSSLESMRWETFFSSVIFAVGNGLSAKEKTDRWMNGLRLGFLAFVGLEKRRGFPTLMPHTATAFVLRRPGLKKCQHQLNVTVTGENGYIISLGLARNHVARRAAECGVRTDRKSPRDLRHLRIKVQSEVVVASTTARMR